MFGQGDAITLDSLHLAATLLSPHFRTSGQLTENNEVSVARCDALRNDARVGRASGTTLADL